MNHHTPCARCLQLEAWLGVALGGFVWGALVYFYVT